MELYRHDYTQEFQTSGLRMITDNYIYEIRFCISTSSPADLNVKAFSLKIYLYILCMKYLKRHWFVTQKKRWWTAYTDVYVVRCWWTYLLSAETTSFIAAAAFCSSACFLCNSVKNNMLSFRYFFHPKNGNAILFFHVFLIALHLCNVHITSYSSFKWKLATGEQN